MNNTTVNTDVPCSMWTCVFNFLVLDREARLLGHVVVDFNFLRIFQTVFQRICTIFISTSNEEDSRVSAASKITILCPAFLKDVICLLVTV